MLGYNSTYFSNKIHKGKTCYGYTPYCVTISCTLERPYNDFMYSLFNGMYLSLTKLNFRCAFMFSNPFLRDSLFLIMDPSVLSLKKEKKTRRL
jgi:hypothetical protein